MFAGWENIFLTSFVLVTALVAVSLAIGGVLVAGWLLREYIRTRGTKPEDLYTVSLPQFPRRNIVSPPFDHTRPREQRVPRAWFGEEPSAQEVYAQEELPF